MGTNELNGSGTKPVLVNQINVEERDNIYFIRKKLI
jgi:hypothetical protein